MKMLAVFSLYIAAFCSMEYCASAFTAIELALLNSAIHRGPCPEGWTNFKAYCYLVNDEIKSQSDAKQWCSDQGGDLVKINSADENEFVLQLVRQNAPSLKQVWIGLERSGNEFYWSDFSLPVYTNWAANEPNGHDNEPCGHMWIAWPTDFEKKPSGSWNDLSCDVRSDFENGLVCKSLS